MKLLIISHTEHYQSEEGEIFGWGPTVNEINHLASRFESITHLAMLHKDAVPPSAVYYTSNHIRFVPMLPLGGPGFLNKLKLVLSIPKVLRHVRRELKDVDAFQLRTPTGIGVFLIPYLTLFSKKKGWYKYAGNWNQKQPPLGYRIQRWLLKNQSRNVTINGSWPNQPKQCLSFENPCLTKQDVFEGGTVVSLKQLEEKINFCYVGRLETPKGVGRIIEAFNNLDAKYRSQIGEVHLVGDGDERPYFEALADKTDINFTFHGYLGRDAVFDIYKKSHYFLMPTTASEGFPKVIAEAFNFGCIPVVSPVSAIAQYVIDDKNGCIITPVTSDGVLKTLHHVLRFTNKDYQKFLKHRQDFVTPFTFGYYTQRILTELLS